MQPHCVFTLLDLSSTAVEKLAEFNDERKCLHCHLSFRFHSTETVKSKLVIVVMYLKVLNLNHFVIVKSISAVILCSAVDLHSFL
jgi:hypothetical protein